MELLFAGVGYSCWEFKLGTENTLEVPIWKSMIIEDRFSHTLLRRKKGNGTFWHKLQYAWPFSYFLVTGFTLISWNNSCNKLININSLNGGLPMYQVLYPFHFCKDLGVSWPPLVLATSSVTFGGMDWITSHWSVVITSQWEDRRKMTRQQQHFSCF